MLALAPMQMLQMLEGSDERIACLRRGRRLAPGGRFAAAILEAMPPPDDSPPPLPDVREVDGWVYSSPRSRPPSGRRIVVRRLRQTVSPDGELDEEPNRVRIATFTAELEAEAATVGLGPAGRRQSDRPTSTSARPSSSSQGSGVRMELRLLALYPEQMNIYADRGNILFLQRRCEWRGIGFAYAGGRAG